LGNWGIAAAVALSCALSSVSNLSADARQFVQAFYNWYVPVLLEPHAESGLALAIAAKPRAFAEDLLRELTADATAQKGADDIVSVSGSFDPFTGSQDPCERYDTGRVAIDGARYLVDVSAVCFSRGGTLRETLKSFRDDRAHARSRQ
jgi:hypothetical protein